MILQALAEYYQSLQAQGKAAAPGWGPVKVSFALYLREDGTLERVVSLQTEQPQGKKTVLAPRVMSLPAPVKRTAGVAANFLWDNSGYLLGADSKGKPRRSAECFAACRALHEKILAGVDTPAARAVLAFFQTWEPKQAAEHPALAEYREEILSGANLVFRFDGTFVHDDPAIRRAWERHYGGAGDSGGPEMVCLVTGEKGPVESVHPSVKGVPGAQSSGAALVSFNAPAFCSYGKEQSLNAPTSRAAAFAYTTALNHLLADREHVHQIGDASVVCWARGGQDAYQSFFGALLGGPAAYSESDLQSMTAQLCQGHEVLFDETRLDPDMDFYVLGLSPNAARLSVRFFLHNTFGGFLKNLQAHQERLKIAQSSDNKFDSIPLWRLLYATVRNQSKSEPHSYKEAKQNLEKYVLPELSGEVLRSILMNTRYPATLHNGVILRIQAERSVTRSQAAVLKAFLLQNYRNLPIYPTLKEALDMELKESCNYQPYVLGRLFAIMEKIQLASTNWSVKRTIKDTYINSVATTPKVIFSRLFPLSEYHMAKLQRDKPSLAKVLEKEKINLVGKLTTSIPSHFNADETDCFYIGYYHQINQKKEENEYV